MEALDVVNIEARISSFRDTYVMIDRDLAELYGVETKVLNQAVKRNIDRFPESFRFGLSKQETQELVTNCDRFNNLKHSTSLPYAFTEPGVAMLSAVLHSPAAVSVRIIQAFVAMRRFMLTNAQVFQRLDRIEYKQLETDKKIDQVFAKLEERTDRNKQCIFFDGQIYDAYEFICDLIRHANKRIVLIDNYVDDSVLTMLDKRGAGVGQRPWEEMVCRFPDGSTGCRCNLAPAGSRLLEFTVKLIVFHHKCTILSKESAKSASVTSSPKRHKMTTCHPVAGGYLSFFRTRQAVGFVVKCKLV